MYHVRRTEREIRNEAELHRIVNHSRFVTVALCRDGEPYAVTLSHGYDEEHGCLYFHAAPEGQKLDFIRSNPLTCATVVEDHGYVTGDCSHKYRSVVLRGTMAMVDDEQEKLHAMEVLVRHHEGQPEQVRRRFLSDPAWTGGVVMLRLDVQEMTGKGNC